MTYSHYLFSTVQIISNTLSGWYEQKEEDRIFELKWLRWQTYIVGIGLDPKKVHSPLDLFKLPDEDALYTGGPGITEAEYERKLKRFEEEAWVFDKWDREMQENYANISGT